MRNLGPGYDLLSTVLMTCMSMENDLFVENRSSLQQSRDHIAKRVFVFNIHSVPSWTYIILTMIRLSSKSSILRYVENDHQVYDI